MEPAGQLMSIKQACIYLFGEYNSSNNRKLQNWRYNGSGPKLISLGHKSKFYRKQDIDAWLDSKASEQ